MGRGVGEQREDSLLALVVIHALGAPSRQHYRSCRDNALVRNRAVSTSAKAEPFGVLCC
jgi:hypothetical protein